MEGTDQSGELLGMAIGNKVSEFLDCKELRSYEIKLS
jgi:hypothetical protein